MTIIMIPVKIAAGIMSLGLCIYFVYRLLVYGIEGLRIDDFLWLILFIGLLYI